MAERPRGDVPTVPVVVAGAIASKLHNGGEAWVRMSWLRAMAAAGCDAWLFEQIDDPTPEQIAWFTHVADWFGAADRAVLADGRGGPVVGPAGVDPRSVAEAAYALVNISGHLAGPTLFERFGRRILVDIDPGYTQMWHAQGLDAGIDDHHVFATIGENITHADCPIPTGGLDWVPTRQPVDPADWAGLPAPDPTHFSTVAAWRGSYGPVTFDGVTYGIKAHEFRKVRDLPSRVPDARLEIALAIHPGDSADSEALVTAGWTLTEPAEASGTPERFRDHVWSCGGEFSVAQGMYVATNSGWFSDRSARFLAAGRPVVVQDTGFGRHLPTGKGLFAFADTDGAAAAIAEVLDDYDAHAIAARSLAASHFDPVAIATDLLGHAR